MRFRKAAVTPSLVLNGLIIAGKEANKTRFQYCKNPNVVLYVRTIQGHAGGEMIALELMGHVVPVRWKEFLYHRGCLT